MNPWTLSSASRDIPLPQLTNKIYENAFAFADYKNNINLHSVQQAKIMGSEKNSAMARKTQQRTAIIHAIEQEDRPLRVGEILNLGREDVPTLDQATVYRNLNRLVDEGAVLRINHPTLGALYERAGKKHHHHFHCRICDRLLELPGCAFDDKGQTPKGFRIESHELFLYGVCSECNVDE